MMQERSVNHHKTARKQAFESGKAGLSMNHLADFITKHPLPAPQSIAKLQLFLGKVCNHSCTFCPHDAQPQSADFMRYDVVHQVAALIERENFEEVIFKGGAPELTPYFRWLVRQIRERSPQTRLVLHTHITSMKNPGFRSSLPNFLKENEVSLVVHVPTLDGDEMDLLRGPGSYKTFQSVTRYFNRLGYGTHASLHLDLIWNHRKHPGTESSKEFMDSWATKMGLVFSSFDEKMYAPVGRQQSCLVQEGQELEHLQELFSHAGHHSHSNLPCQESLTVDWEGNVFNCENHLSVKDGRIQYRLFHLTDWSRETLNQVRIQPALHCLSCMACFKN
ncbi:radical SAM protein [Algoriphagus confluentis]|uniref:Arsenosugar biosynthesis radical SAM protein ArsS n=1 Tax=Algoriphagus confluentis TaxID=1697556 RepID=A0ABQ6PKR2_9BACT|nr:arsenosugar biosynthesis radical SAM protein ArsS [Algoriphagus confluentis]